MGKDEGEVKTVAVNWTIVATGVCVALVAGVVIPLVWRIVSQTEPEEMKIVGLLLVVLLIFAVFVLALIGAVKAFGSMALRFLQQDDADELRKSQELTAQLAKLSQKALHDQASANTSQADLVQLMLDALERRQQQGQGGAGDGHATNAYRDATGGDVEIG